jgi:hypothetical protein
VIDFAAKQKNNVDPNRVRELAIEFAGNYNA